MNSAFFQALAAWAFVMEEHDRALFGLINDYYIPNNISKECVEVFRLHFRLKREYLQQETTIWRREHRQEYTEELEADIIRELLKEESRE